MHSPQQNTRAAPAEPTSDDDSWADFVADTVMSMKPVSMDVIRAVQVSSSASTPLAFAGLPNG